MATATDGTEAVDGRRLTRVKRVVFADGDEPVEFLGYEVGSRPDHRRFVGVDASALGPEVDVNLYLIPVDDLLFEEVVAD